MAPKPTGFAQQLGVCALTVQLGPESWEKRLEDIDLSQGIFNKFYNYYKKIKKRKNYKPAKKSDVNSATCYAPWKVCASQCPLKQIYKYSPVPIPTMSFSDARLASLRDYIGFMNTIIIIGECLGRELLFYRDS